MSMHPRRRFAFQLAGLSLSGLTVPALARGDDDNLREGKVFISTNAVGGNALLAFAPADGGGLDMVAQAATGGVGTGGGLGSQAAVALSKNGRFLFVVNAGSSTVSTFEISGSGLRLASVVASGGMLPISVAEHDGLVYVLNAADPGNVAGFRNVNGELTPIANSVRALSASGGTGPAQVGFSSDGNAVVVTEKSTSVISSYPVLADGTLGAIVVTPSPAPTPFGFAFDRRGTLVVSEAPTSSASSYRFDPRAPATPVLVSAAVGNGQGAACWVVIAPSGRIAYTANAATSTLSSYRILPTGAIALANPVAGSTGNNAGALDLAMSTGGRRLYALAQRSWRIVAFSVEYEGDLTPLGVSGVLPAGSAGLAAN